MAELQTTTLCTVFSKCAPVGISPPSPLAPLAFLAVAATAAPSSAIAIALSSPVLHKGTCGSAAQKSERESCRQCSKCGQTRPHLSTFLCCTLLLALVWSPAGRQRTTNSRGLSAATRVLSRYMVRPPLAYGEWCPSSALVGCGDGLCTGLATS